MPFNSRYQHLAFRLAIALAVSGGLGGAIVAGSWWLSFPVLRLPLAESGLATEFLGGIALALTGIAAVSGFFAGVWKRVSLLTSLLVLLVVLWSLSHTMTGWPALYGAESLPPPSVFTFLFLAVGTLGLQAATRRRVTVTVVAAVVALLTCLYKLAIYTYWLQNPADRILLLSLPPQTAALESLLALALLSHSIHTLRKLTDKAPKLVLSSYGLMAVICVLGWAYFTNLESRTIRKESVQLAANVSRVLEEHVYRSLDPIDLLFVDTARQVATDGLASVTKSKREWSALKAMADALPQVSALLIFDAEGEFRSFTQQFPPPSGNYSFREYFQAHQAGKRRYLGELIAADTSGKPIFTYSHRLTDNDGNFAGVILASLEIDYFRSFYRSLDLGPGAAVGLWRRDGKLLMREPLLPNIAGQHLDQHPIYTNLIHENPTGTFLGYSPYDGEQKLVLVKSERTHFQAAAANSISLGVW